MRTVYIESTIPSYYFETRRDSQSQLWRHHTRQWWHTSAGGFRLVTSSFTIEELTDAPEPKRSQSIALLRGVEEIEHPAELYDVIAFYHQHQLMPRGATGDAAHLAIASLAQVDFLLTWNLQHLANANKHRHMVVLNSRLGLPTPIITTPLTLPGDSSHES